MTEPFRKLRLVSKPSTAVIEFRPYRTQKGHYVWHPYAALADFGALPEIEKTPYAGLRRGSAYNLKLTSEEVVHFLGSGLPPLKHTPADAVNVVFECFDKAKVPVLREGVIVLRTGDPTEFIVTIDGEKFLIKASRITK